MAGKKKKKKWRRFRHRVVRNILSILLSPYIKLKYGIKVKRFKNTEKRPHLILFNHQTAFDQFFVGMAFKGPIYYVASEDLFSNGFVSSLIRYLVAPIPIKKQTTDVSAVMNCIRIAKEGGTIAIAPEGNRTYSGKTGYMGEAIAPLARKLGMPIALLRIEGGYGVHPRWSDVVRKGKMQAGICKVISPEEYKDMTDRQLYNAISEALYVDESTPDSTYKHKKRAEYIERAIYTCPHCGLSKIESHGSIIECKKCSRKVEYTEQKQLRGVGFDFPFKNLSEWYDYQSELVNSLNPDDFTDKPISTDKVTVKEVIPYKKKKKLLKDVSLNLYGDRIEVTDKGAWAVGFDKASAFTVLGKNKLNMYWEGSIYQFKGTKRFSALKYVQIFHRYDNVMKGEPDGKFLGL